jgi:hypothetical protein
VADALRDALAKVERGEIAADVVYIAFAAKTPDGTLDCRSVRAGGGTLELIGLLSHHLHGLNSEKRYG